MRSVIVSIMLVAVCLLVISTVGKSQGQRAGAAKQDLTSNQVLMRDKLVHMNRILEGLTLDKFDQVVASGETLRMISVATSWHVSDPTPRYELLKKNFQEQSLDLQRHAKEKNVDAATLDLVRLNITCAQCHLHMREIAARPK
jgi:hypothetical protein